MPFFEVKNFTSILCDLQTAAPNKTFMSPHKKTKIKTEGKHTSIFHPISMKTRTYTIKPTISFQYLTSLIKQAQLQPKIIIKKPTKICSRLLSGYCINRNNDYIIKQTTPIISVFDYLLKG